MKEQVNTEQKKSRPGGKKAVDSKYTTAVKHFVGSDASGEGGKKPPRTVKQKGIAKKTARENFSKWVAVVFVLLIGSVFVSGFFIPDESFSPDENRILQEAPGFSLSGYFEGRFENKLERYVEDQFPMRNAFIRMKSAMDMTAGVLESNDVVKCRDNYLMERIKAPGDNLKKTEKALEDFRKRYPNLKMYFLLVPNAANILSEKLPYTVHMEDQNKYMDDFFKKAESFGYKLIDVRDEFNEDKDVVQLYYRTDHHWTTDGAYMAYRYAIPLMELGEPLDYMPYVVKNDFNGTLYSRSGYTNGLCDEIKIYIKDDKEGFIPSAIYYADTKEKTTEFYQMDNLETKDAYSVFGGSNHPLYTIKTPVENKNRLLIVKDSYANSFIPFMAQHYREVVVVDPRYYFENIDDLMATESITEVLFLYNANTFFLDDSIAMTLSDESVTEAE